jgi:hypothetical protein
MTAIINEIRSDCHSTDEHGFFFFFNNAADEFHDFNSCTEKSQRHK